MGLAGEELSHWSPIDPLLGLMHSVIALSWLCVLDRVHLTLENIDATLYLLTCKASPESVFFKFQKYFVFCGKTNMTTPGGIVLWVTQSGRKETSSAHFIMWRITQHVLEISSKRCLNYTWIWKRYHNVPDSPLIKKSAFIPVIKSNGFWKKGNIFYLGKWKNMIIMKQQRVWRTYTRRLRQLEESHIQIRTARSVQSIQSLYIYIAPYRGPREVTDGLVGLIQIWY